MSATSSAAADRGATPLDTDELRLIDAWWRAANYLSVGQIYLLDNPLLREPLSPQHVKPRLLGHWGTTPGLNMHLRAPQPGDPGPRPRRDLRHRARARRSGHRRQRLPGGHLQRGLPAASAATSRACAACSASSRFRAASRATSRPRPPVHPRGRRARLRPVPRLRRGLRQPRPRSCACVVGDGEAETGPLATSWHSNKFLDPARDGAVLPILHLNGYKIANPTVLARIPARRARRADGRATGTGRTPSRATTPPTCTSSWRRRSTRRSTRSARSSGPPARTASRERPRWPMIVFRTPKGWTGPTQVDGHQVEGTWRAHQVPMGEVRTNADHRALLESGCARTAPTSCSTRTGRLRA